MGDLRLPPPPENGDSALPPSLSSDILIPNTISKRQRRPSVRLGEIGSSNKFSKINSPSSIPIPSKLSTKSRASARRVRTNWPSRLDEGFEPAADLKSEEDSGDDEFAEDSARVRVSDGGDEQSEEGFKGWAGGVRPWLDGLGLGRYAPVYEIHEVDDEVLPMLTLEDLKDMGINAVGSRRKMYCAIQKLRKSRDL